MIGEVVALDFDAAAEADVAFNMFSAKFCVVIGLYDKSISEKYDYYIKFLGLETALSDVFGEKKFPISYHEMLY